MEDNNKTAPAQNAQAQNSQAPGGENKNRRRRGHRGGKKHQEKKQRAAAAAAAAAENAQKGEGAPQKNDKNADTVSKNAPKRDKKNDNRNRQNQNKRDGRKQPDRPLQKNDGAGALKNEDELAEWRAKIVLNATPAPTPAKEEEPIDEPTPQLSNEELFASPISTATPATSEENEEKVEVIGIRFRSAGKVYYFDPRGQKLKKGEFAIVETARGPEFGEVSLENTMVNVSETVTPLRPIIRIATPADIEHNAENREKEKEALVICQQKIEAHKLDMKLIDVQYAFDNSKLLFYFSSDGRVDFRELVKDLASVFRTRIELRQIGIRDEAKMLGGIGSCGRMLCCSTFLPDFAQVSIKMAKEQGLSLNSAKISGMCGRLMCCLHFESQTYTEEIRRTPAVDSQVKTEDGIGTVISINPLAGTIRVVLKDSPDTPPKQYHRSEVTPLGKAPKNTENAEEIED